MDNGRHCQTNEFHEYDPIVVLIGLAMSCLNNSACIVITIEI